MNEYRDVHGCTGQLIDGDFEAYESQEEADAVGEGLAAAELHRQETKSARKSKKAQPLVKAEVKAGPEKVKAAQTTKTPDKAADKAPAVPGPFDKIAGANAPIRAVLTREGLDTELALSTITDEALRAVEGIGPKVFENIRKAYPYTAAPAE